MITQSINLNLIPGGVLPRINVSQYDDDSRTLSLNLYSGNVAYSVPAGSSVNIVGTKKDRTGFEYACTFSGSTVSVDITDQMTAFAGEVVCELRISKSGATIGTSNFVLNVEPSALSDDTVISETDIPIIQQIPQYVQDCADKAKLAESWAVGGTGTRTGEDTNNAEYWANQSQAYAIGAFHWKASVAFASIPTTGLTNGDVYNITDDFITDSRFVEGSGIKCAAGTNIVWNGSKWDILTPSTDASQVRYDNTLSGMSATNTQNAIDELAYSKLDKTGDSKDNTTTYTALDDDTVFNSGNLGGQYAWEVVNKPTSGMTHAYLFRKMSAMFKNIRYIAKLIGTTDISAIGDGTISGSISGINSNLSANTFGTPVGLAADNEYTTPKDGYLELSFGGGSNLTGYVTIKDSNNVGFSIGTNNSGTTYEVRSLFVKKGMVLKLSSNATASAIFYPLNY